MKHAVILTLCLLAGCSSTSDEAIRVIREYHALTRHPAPGDPAWDARLKIADANAAELDDGRHVEAKTEAKALPPATADAQKGR